VGIVPNVMYDDLRTRADRMFYVPFYQRYAEGEYVFAVRTSGNADVLVRQIPREIATVAPNMPVLGISSVARQIDTLTANERLLVTVSGFVGALALILVGIGIYGIVAYTVTRRIPELGLRVALGANARQVVWLLLRGAITVLTAGVVIGLAAGMAATQLLTELVFGIAANDPRVYAMAAAIVIGAGLLSTIVPLARALRVDPVTALRYE
jgi:putative ABC transport system permease protein